MKGCDFMANQIMKTQDVVGIIQSLFDNDVVAISEESATLLSMWQKLNDSQKLKYFASLYSDTANLKDAS